MGNAVAGTLRGLLRGALIRHVALGPAALAVVGTGCGSSSPGERAHGRPAERPACGTIEAGAWCTGRKLEPVVQIAVATDESLCLRMSDRTVACSGARGMADGRPLAGRPGWAGVQEVGGLSGVIDVAVGTSGLACAVESAGALWCWGDPRLYSEQVVQAATSRQPGRVSAATDVVEIALRAERGRSLIRKRDGSVWRWRWDDRAARYGVGSSAELEPIEGLEGTDALAVSSIASCARKGVEVHCVGQLQDTAGASLDLGDADVPRKLEALPEAFALSVSEQEVCVTTAGGAVHCARVDAEALAVTEIPAVKGAVSLASGARHSCALTATGEVYCWGDNRAGQLGHGAPDARGPVKVTGLRGATCIAAHGNRTCACVGDQAPWCWGVAGKKPEPVWRP